MLIVGTWVALLLYIISWISGLYVSAFKEPSQSRFAARTEHTGMLIAWFVHTFTLLGLLWTKSVWPISFVSDFLNVAAWGSVVVIQAFPERFPSLINTSIVRLFVILLLGLSLIISQRQVFEGELVSAQTWLYHLLLGSHIIILMAGYVMLGVACVASIIFLYQEHHLKTKLVTSLMIRFPALGTLDRISWEGTLWGFLALSIGIMLGILINTEDNSLLANLRFATSISAWCVFAMLLLLRQLQKVRTRWNTVAPIIGFFLAMLSLIVELVRINLPA
ncbi:MAG: cytochrome c biogenesis protein CcsA [SAR324 cluster bacterium]|nr:cytochrome c biogenesis protein CcsA [SAR324 cluster bacterium]MBL7035168.1 cytochrome c biogenesis protein CcsA [SAR324 cluster bacterium]